MMKFKMFLNLIRYQNLALIALMQLIFRYGFFGAIGLPQALNDWQFILLIIATLAIAAGGNIINDIYDQNTDQINKPGKNNIGIHIDEDSAFNIFIALNIVGLSIGFYLSNAIEKTSFLGIFIISSMLSYLYATSFKKTLLIGNIIVSLLLSFTVLVIGLFDILPATFPQVAQTMKAMFGIIIDFTFFSFLINLIREIVKDMEDIDGDYNQGMNTLPIAIGIARTAKIVSILSVIGIIILLWYVNQNFMEPGYYITTIYAAIFILAPLGFVAVKIWTSKNKKDFTLISTLLKFIILFGILSLLVIAFDTH